VYRDIRDINIMTTKTRRIVQIELLNEHAQVPSTNYKGNACYDIHATEEISISPGERGKVPTGIRAHLPSGYEMLIRPRSGLALKHGITVLNAPGTIDSNYRGEIFVILVNLSTDVFTVHRGDRIAQCCVKHVIDINFIVADKIDVDVTQRGENGFGSSGI
jgi:dUTP pyrophosphatase